MWTQLSSDHVTDLLYPLPAITSCLLEPHILSLSLSPPLTDEETPRHWDTQPKKPARLRGLGRAGDRASLTGEKVHVAQRGQESFQGAVVPQLDLEGQVGFEQVLMEVTIPPRMWCHRPCHWPCARPPRALCEVNGRSALQARAARLHVISRCVCEGESG